MTLSMKAETNLADCRLILQERLSICFLARNCGIYRGICRVNLPISIPLIVAPEVNTIFERFL